MAQNLITETTPLVRNETVVENGEKGQATVLETILNLSKTCMGTGCLALAYGCQQGGVFVYCMGLAGIALWNIYASERLVRCRSLLRHVQHVHDEEHDSRSLITKRPPENASTLSKVAFYAFGQTGLHVMDTLMIILLLGIVVSYLSAVVSFVSDTPLTIGRLGDASVVAVLMCILSLGHIAHLSYVSLAGLLVLLFTFIIIAGYGLAGLPGSPDETSSLPLWPTSNVGLSHFFGVCVFGFGTVPLTFNFEESMKNPELMVPATAGALTGVALLYMLVGVGLLALFPHVTGEVLHELPSTGWLPTTTRLAMAVVIVLTAPLLIVPTGELLEGKFRAPRILVRCAVCMVSVCVAVLLPTFVQVLAFVGCACVGFVSFCVPPILHIRLVLVFGEVTRTTSAMLFLDVAMILWGLIATVLGTIYTLG